MEMTAEQFVAYLKERLIPDLRESGRHMTAADFEAAVLFIQGAEVVHIDGVDEDATATKVR